MKKKMVGNVPGNVLGMLADLTHKLQHGVITAEELAMFLKRDNSFKEPNISILLSDWQNFYHHVFRIEADFSDLQIPEKQPGLDRLIIVVKEMTPQKLYDKCKELFPCWKWTNENLDKIIESERTSEKSHYAIWVRNRIEADKELKNLSADDLKQRNIPGITVEERLAYELKYFKETESHLDVKNVTLCAGSRYFDGNVPDVRWYDGRLLGVSWSYSSSHLGYLRSRRVVS